MNKHRKIFLAVIALVYVSSMYSFYLKDHSKYLGAQPIIKYAVSDGTPDETEFKPYPTKGLGYIKNRIVFEVDAFALANNNNIFQIRYPLDQVCLLNNNIETLCTGSLAVQNKRYSGLKHIYFIDDFGSNKKLYFSVQTQTATIFDGLLWDHSDFYDANNYRTAGIFLYLGIVIGLLIFLIAESILNHSKAHFAFLLYLAPRQYLWAHNH